MSTVENIEPTHCEIREADRVEVISLIDNSADFQSTTDKKQVKSFRQWTKTSAKLPVAEHGFSMLVRTSVNGKVHTVLFDMGLAPEESSKTPHEWGWT